MSMKSLKNVLNLPILSEKSLANRMLSNQYVFRVPQIGRAHV